VIAHVGGVPLEETLLPLVSGMGAGLLMARVWIASRIRRPRSSRSPGCGAGGDGRGDEVEDGTTARFRVEHPAVTSFESSGVGAR
jgi:hypothetical protein